MAQVSEYFGFIFLWILHGYCRYAVHHYRYIVHHYRYTVHHYRYTILTVATLFTVPAEEVRPPPLSVLDTHWIRIHTLTEVSVFCSSLQSCKKY
jgi:hypothetical protein